VWIGHKHRGGAATDYFAGLDVSLEETAVCVVDETGRIVREARVASLDNSRPLAGMEQATDLM
jgi:hypothetical protein